ncbi:hypothetical protein [Thalassoglobus polymorphus]|uniref:Uncharacterized protein n=1 Tax=Thalassoglobus polymorphus TaxID=2527994 RepID=A0A517QH12_9PLAN|nr:hypothetical protein [Thalassoglobus polymorphus]QDT30922.1 hypothetical protein Mal48_01510 [Thalassoglobus polymorphus]QDT30967.1 hypothetical protein Mal48_01960 [Thalassoglobus polymorphus]
MNHSTRISLFRNLLGHLRAGGPSRRTMFEVGAVLEAMGYSVGELQDVLRSTRPDQLAVQLADSFEFPGDEYDDIETGQGKGGQPGGDDSETGENSEESARIEGATPVAVLGLPKTIVEVLQASGYLEVEQVSRNSANIEDVNGIGPASANKIREALDDYYKKLKGGLDATVF